MTPADFIRNMSDHQVMGMVEVMLDDDHRLDDATAVYVTAYEEAKRRNLLTEEDPNVR